MTTTITKRKSKKETNTLPGESKGAIHPSDAPQLPRLENPDPTVIDIPLKHLVPHAANRMISDESVADLAASIAEVGQLEPATVRRLPRDSDDRHDVYELLSGERRLRACSVAKIGVLRCIVVEDSNSHSMVRLAAANTNRKDLNPIERAQLIEQLLRPIDQGGSGLDRLAAGRAVGLQSESGVKNTLRLLKLPATIRGLVSSGELSERAARRLIPFVELPAVMDDIETALTGAGAKNHINDLSDDEYFPYWLTKSIEKHTRPMDSRKVSMQYLDKGSYASAPKLFECDDSMLKQFAPIEITVENERWQVTANTKEWDKLQKPLLQSTATKGVSKSTSKTAEQTPAQKAAEEKQRQKQADERLDHYTLQWTAFALRCQLANWVGPSNRLMTFGFLAGAYESGGNRLHEIVTAAYAESEIEIDKAKKSILPKQYAALPKLQRDEAGESFPGKANQHIASMWRLMLWPVLIDPRSPSILKATAKDWALAGDLPDLDRLPRIASSAVRQLATYCNIGMGDFWASAALPTDPARKLLTVWLARHTTEQLNALWRELKLAPLKASVKRSEMVDLLLAEHTPEKKLPLPKRLAK